MSDGPCWVRHLRWLPLMTAVFGEQRSWTKVCATHNIQQTNRSVNAAILWILLWFIGQFLNCSRCRRHQTSQRPATGSCRSQSSSCRHSCLALFEIEHAATNQFKRDAQHQKVSHFNGCDNACSTERLRTSHCRRIATVHRAVTRGVRAGLKFDDTTRHRHIGTCD